MLQLVPLTPKSTVFTEIGADAGVVFEGAIAEPIEAKVGKAPGKQTNKKKAGKSAKQKSAVTVQICQKKNCCKKGGDDLWKAFEAISAEHPFTLEPVGCLGGCKRGPNIRLLPDNVKYRHVQLAEIDNILQTHRA